MNDLYQSNKKWELSAIFGLCIEFAVSVGLFILGLWLKSTVVTATAVYGCAGCFLWVMVYLHLRQARLAAEENQDISGTPSDQGLFQEDKTAVFSASDKLRQMEKIFLTSASAVLGLILIFLGYYFLKKNIYVVAIDGSKQNIAAVTLIIIAFFSFLTGKFCAGLSSGSNATFVLKYPAGILLSVSFISFFLTVSFILNYFGYSWAYKLMGYFVPVWMSLIGIDFIIHIILDFYRPRVKGQFQKPPYQSFLANILSQPQGIFIAAAHSLDYQFGFKISQTWFYRFIEKIIAPLILFQLLVLYSLTTIVIIKPHECGILETFGLPDKQKGILKPGFHLKLPWPVQKIRVIPYLRIQSVFINPADEKEDTLLWCVEHHEDRKMLLLPGKSEQESPSDNEGVTGIPVNWLSVTAEIQYTVKDPFNYLYNQKNPDSLVYNLSWRELIETASSIDMFDFLGPQRITLGESLKNGIQTELDKLKSGIEIVFVGVYELHPPAEVGEAFESVVDSIEEKQTKILSAEIQRNKLVPRAKSRYKSIISEAQSYTAVKKLVSESEIVEFENQLAAYTISPEIYIWRRYLASLKKGIADTRKIIISSEINTDETTVLDLMEKTQPDLMDISITGKEDKSQ